MIHFAAWRDNRKVWGILRSLAIGRLQRLLHPTQTAHMICRGLMKSVHFQILVLFTCGCAMQLLHDASRRKWLGRAWTCRDNSYLSVSLPSLLATELIFESQEATGTHRLISRRIPVAVRYIESDVGQQEITGVMSNHAATRLFHSPRAFGV